MRRSRDDIDLSFRVGAGSIGLFAGGAFGLCLAFALMAAGLAYVDLAMPVLGGALAGAVSGLLMPRDTMDAVESLLHFLFGYVLERTDLIDAHAPRHLRLAFLFGSMTALLTYLLMG